MLEQAAVEPERDPVEREIDELLDEHGGDARVAIRALLHDLEVLARDNVATSGAVSFGYVRGKVPRAS